MLATMPIFVRQDESTKSAKKQEITGMQGGSSNKLIQKEAAGRPDEPLLEPQ